MCGIAGFLDSNPPADPRAVLARMTAVIRHRGPDATGLCSAPPAWLGHCRLSIVDLAGGAQPMHNESGDISVVYNGEIFNHAALSPELERSGHRYASRCDTETILHAYEQWGPACLHRFRGMFAFALWDRASQTLFCARDRLGIKPFYYFWDGRLFAFASEIKALFQHPSIAARCDESLLPEYLAFGYTSGEGTLFAGIRKLMPGHTLTLTAGRPESFCVRQYWDLPPADPDAPAASRDWIPECRARLEETVRMRLMSDVPLGMFLSGGVDSSAIAAIMRRLTEGPVRTFSVGYRETAYSELSWARQVAEAIGTEHHEVTLGLEDFFNTLPLLVWHEDEPVTWPSSVSLYFVSRLAAQSVKVVLTGEGADELFAGYSRYRFFLANRRWGRAYALLPAGLRRVVRDRIGTSPVLSAGLRRRLGHTFVGRDSGLDSLYLDNFYSAFSVAEQHAFFGASPAASPYAGFHRFWNGGSEGPLLDRLLRADQKTYLVELLMKQDQMSMAASIESRVPFLDHTFVEFAAAVPAGLKIRRGTAKYILKEAVRDLLPRSVVYRRKMGFPTPLRDWLLDPRARPLLDRLRDPRGFLAATLDPHAVAALLARHLDGAEDATDRIWRLLNLQLWGDRFLLGRSPEPLLAPSAA